MNAPQAADESNRHERRRQQKPPARALAAGRARGQQQRVPQVNIEPRGAARPRPRVLGGRRRRALRRGSLASTPDAPLAPKVPGDDAEGGWASVGADVAMTWTRDARRKRGSQTANQIARLVHVAHRNDAVAANAGAKTNAIHCSATSGAPPHSPNTAPV